MTPNPDVAARSSPPLVDKPAELPAFRKPGDRMDVVGHHDKPDTRGRLVAQLFVQHAENDPLEMVAIEQTVAAIKI